jgi:photosystem II stability/assembly factor-like uncharacterized protein
MKLACSIQIIIIFYIAALCGCKKGDSAGTNPPLPVVKPDTLKNGWVKINIDSTESFSDVFFKDNNIGYLTGKNTYQSTNGGLSWTKKASRGFGNIFVTPNNNIFFAGNQTYLNDSVYRSVDGAITFSPAKLDSKATDIFFTDNNNGFCFTLNSLWNTTNGGVTWNNNFPATPGANGNIGYCSLYFRTNTLGWLIDGNEIFKTSGSIANWQYSFAGVNIPGNFLTSIFAPSNNIVFVINNIGEFYKSADGGATFNLIKYFGDFGFGDIHFLDDNLGYVSYRNRVYKTTDGGINWTIEVAMGEAGINEIHFTDASHGWACGTNGVFLKFN